jgi:hypothetical protein
MKSFLLLSIISIFVTIETHALVTLTQANSSPVIGEVYVSYNIDTNIEAGVSGANITWVLDHLSTGSPITSSAVDPTTTPNTNFFTSSNVALNSMGGYQYLISSASSLIQLGASASGQIQINNPGINYFNYPFSYNSVCSTTNFSGTHVQGTFTGSSVTTGDAYGSLILDGQVFSDVLRVQVVQDIDYDYTNIGHIIYHNVTYSWYDGNHNYPIMQIITSHFDGLSSGNNKSVTVASFVTGKSEIISPVSFLNLSPNPARENSNISFSLMKSSEVMIKIYNCLGEVVYIKNLGYFFPGSFKEAMDLTNFEKGFYSIYFITDDIQISKKLIVD